MARRASQQSSNTLSTTAVTPMTLATAAALDSAAFGSITANDAIPAAWEDRARQAWTYYVEEPLVKNCLNSWRSFAMGDEIKFSSDEETVKSAVEELAGRLALSTFVKDMVLQLLVKGDAVGFKRYAKDGKDIEELTCVNPTSAKVKYAHGTLIELRQYPEDTPATGEGLKLPIEQVLHLKWDAPPFSPRGNSLVLPAFQSIELLRDYRKAEQAIAKRWATPFRLIKVGGAFGQKMVMPDQKMLEGVRDIINKMDLKSGLVVPFYVTVETHGTEGQVLNVEEKVKEVKEDIMVALGLSRSLVTGDGPNFATASVSLQKMLIMIREIKQAARQVLAWVIDDWQELHGYGDSTVQFIFNDLDLSDAVDIKKLLLELYDRKLISRASLQMKMDLDPDVETANREHERTSVDLLDEKQIKPIVDMVAAGIMGIETAQQLLGLDPEKNKPATAAAIAALGGPFTRAALQDEVCDDCRHFDEEENHCRVQRTEATFDQSACRFFDARMARQAAVDSPPASRPCGCDQ
ncbi:MAG: phage portal protein family protein [Armatimonadota bacterium]